MIKFMWLVLVYDNISEDFSYMPQRTIEQLQTETVNVSNEHALHFMYKYAQEKGCKYAIAKPVR